MAKLFHYDKFSFLRNSTQVILYLVMGYWSVAKFQFFRCCDWWNCEDHGESWCW